MISKVRRRRSTWAITTLVTVSILVSYAAVAASSRMRPPTVVVTFNIVRVTADLAERGDSEARLRMLVTKIEDEQKRRYDSINALQKSLEPAAEVDREPIREELEKQLYEAKSYDLFANLQIDSERSLMFRDLYQKIRTAVSEIAKENGYDLVLISDVDRDILINKQSKVPHEIQVRDQIEYQRVVFSSDQIDITEQIVTHMNLEWEKRSDK